MSDWAQETDLIIVGSGAGAMTAAVVAQAAGAEVLVLEKSDQYGGSTAMSGGTVWIPNNHKMGAAGVQDSREEALTYMKHVTRGEVPLEKLETYVDAAPAMMKWLEDNTHVEFTALSEQCDYYPEAPGGKPGGRSVEATPYAGPKLGEEFAKLRWPHPQQLVLGTYCITGTEARKLVRGSWWIVPWRMLAYRFDFKARSHGKRDGRLTFGNALMGRLRHSMMARDIPLSLETEVKELIVEDERVVGVVVERQGKAGSKETLRIKAKKGVLLAAGGFARNDAMRQQYQKGPVSADWSAANPHNLGAAIEMAQALGAGVDLMEEAWWTPCTLIPGKDVAWILVVEKNMPGGIIVNQQGKRFTNESSPYLEVVKGYYDDPAGPSVPAWLIFDGRYRRKYPLGPLPPASVRPDSKLGRRYREGFFHKADTLAELAEKAGIDPAGLEAEVEKFNGFATRGKDEDFGRGESLYDRYYSDPAMKPNPSLAPLARAPYYCIPVYPGDLGTKGGLTTDTSARVLREDGGVIEGLYATGNCSASMMGPTYPGAGGTIGPAMTFGYLAAKAVTS